MNASKKISVYHFANFCFNPETMVLKKAGKTIELKLQPARLLKILLQHAPDVVLRTTIYDGLWGSRTTVEFDQSLNACIRQLRTVLGDSATMPTLIETLPKRGYRFLAVVKSNRSTSRLRALAGSGAVMMATVIGAIVLLSPESSPANEPIRLYVSPVEVADAPNDVPVSLLQYGLRLSIVDQLTRSDDNNLLTVNGETLWAAEQLLRLNKETDYRLVIRISLEGDAYLADVKLVRDGEDTPSGERIFEINEIDASGLEGASMDIAQWAASYLGSSLSRSRAIIPDVDPQYYHAIVQAKRLLQIGDRAALVDSVDWGEKALLISPTSTEAKGNLALALTLLAGGERFPADLTYARALSYANEIRDAVGATVESELTRGFIGLYYEWDLPKAREAFDLALELAPGNALVHAWRAGILAAQGDVASASAAADIAVKLDPLSMTVVADRCWYLGMARRFDEAVTACSWAVEQAPERFWSIIGLGVAFEKLGREDEALTALAPLVAITLEREKAAGGGYIQSQTGVVETPHPPEDFQDAHCRFADIQTPRAERGDFPLYDLAVFNALCGRMEIAASLLESAKKAKESAVLFYNDDPRLDAFRISPEAEKVDMTITVRHGV